MATTGQHPPRGPNFDEDHWYDNLIGQKGSRQRRWVWRIGIVLILAALWYFGVLGVAFRESKQILDSMLSSNQEIANVAPALTKKAKPDPAKAGKAKLPTKPATAASAAPNPQITLALDCLTKQRDELKRTRQDRVKEMGKWVVQQTNPHQLSADEAKQVDDYFIKNPDGDVPISADGVVSWVHVWDKVRPGKKLDVPTFQLECKCKPIVHFKVPWVALKHAPTVVVERHGDCAVVHFHSRPGDKIVVDLDSATGPIRESRCNVRWEGRGPHHQWAYDECGAPCTPMKSVTGAMLGRPINWRISRFYWATGYEQFVSFDPSAKDMVLALCITYVENGRRHSTNFLFVIPVDALAPSGETTIRWSSRVNIPNGAFTMEW